MGTVMICGKEYPLCMTVEAFSRITQVCGGLDKLGNYLDGNGDIGKMISNTAFILAILLQEGEENRRMVAGFYADGDTEARKFQVVPPCGGHHVISLIVKEGGVFQVVPPCGGHPQVSSQIFAPE